MNNRYTQSRPIRSENGTTITITDGNGKRTNDDIEKIPNSKPPDKYTTRTQIIQESQNWGSTVKFTEIKSLKRIHKVNEGIETDHVTDLPGIINPYTGEVMTLRDAIAARIFDVRTAKIVASPDGTQVTIDEALERGLIDPKIINGLYSHCGISEDNRQLTLLEAIQRELYEAEHGFIDPSEKRIKVTNSSTIKQAIDDGKVDVNTGTYTLESGEIIDIKEAYKRGYLLQHTEVKLQTGAVALSDAINQGLIDDRTGWIVDRNSGNKYQIDAAVKTNVIDGDIREIVDPKTDDKITVIEALDQGLINAKLGKYVFFYEKFSFLEAKRRQLVVKPKTLKEVVDDGLMDEEGKILSPLHQTKLTILEAVSKGVLDVDLIKSVLDFRKNELLTLGDAIKEGIISPEGKFVNLVTGESMSIHDAVSRGYLISVLKKSIFDVDGFQPPDKSDYVSYNAANAKGYISQKSNGSLLVNSKNGKLIPFTEGVKTGEVKPEVYEMLSRDIGIFENQKELTVLEAVFRGYIDPKTGNLIDVSKNKVIYLNEAIAQHLITPEGAAMLNSLLNLNVSTQITRTLVQRYVTVSNKELKSSQYTYTDALRLGLIDNENQTYKDPETNEIIPIVQAISESRLAPDSENIPKNSTVITISSKKIRPSPEKSASEKQVYELPVEGWSLEDAISQKLFDPITGLFIIPGTDRLTSLTECITLKIINPSSAVVVDPSNQRNISLIKGVSKKILDDTGHYNLNGEKLNMKDAIEQGLIILESKMEVEPSSQRLLQITKLDGKPAKVEVSNVLDNYPPVYTEIKVPEETRLQPLEIQPGLIYDPTNAVVINSETKETANLIAAVQENKIPTSSIAVKDPQTGKQITIVEAIRRNIVDKSTGDYINKSGHKISLTDAAKYGILTVVGAPIAASYKIVKTIQTFVVDPNTGEEISSEEALQKGVIDQDNYNKVIEDAKSSHAFATKSPIVADTTVTVTDPKTNKSYTAHDALNQGIITPQQFNELHDLSEADKVRARITMEPTYTVKIGRAQTLSPDRDAKKVVLQKARRKVVRITDAVEKGIVDPETAKLLAKATFTAANGDSLTLQEALDSKIVSGDQGRIRDPQRGDEITISEAIERGILDPDGTNELLVPLNRSLSIPELLEQGLIDPKTAKIVHPETGAQLSISQAIVCDIVDPLSTVMQKTGEKLTLGEALEKGIIDDDKLTIDTIKGPINLSEAVKDKIFVDNVPENVQNLPKLGMTFSVALQRGLVDSEKKEIIHPITKKRIPLEEAINGDFIMAIPFPSSSESIKVEDALESNLIDLQNGTFIDSKSGEIIPVNEALEKGLIIVKESSIIVTSQPITTVTETVNTIHTVTTRTIELLSGYALLSATEIQDTKTGQIMSIDEARKQGIVINDNETKNTTTLKDIKMSFAEAVNKGLVDMSAGIFIDPTSGEKILIKDALEEGKLIGSSPTISTKTTDLNMAEAYDTIYNESTNTFQDPADSSKTLTFEEVVEKEIIDPNSMIYDVIAQKPVTVHQAIEQGLIDSKTGQVKDEKTGKNIDFKEAAKKGLIAVLGGLALPVVAPVLAGAAAVKAVKEYAAKKHDPASKSQEGKVEIQIIKQENQIEEKQTKTAIEDTIEIIEAPLEQITIGEALARNKIAPEVCRILFQNRELPFTVKDGLTLGKVYSTDVVEVVSKNLVRLLEQPSASLIYLNKEITPQKLAEMGYYDLKSRKFIDPHTGAQITFQEFIYDVGLFNPDRILVKDLTSKPPVYITLEEALQKPLIDKNTGYMVDSKTGKRVPFFEAVKLRWIIDVRDQPKEKHQPLTLEEIVETDHFDPIKVEFKNIPLSKALVSNVIDPKSVSIRDERNNQLIPYYEAVDKQIVDPQRALVLNTATQQNMIFSEAFALGFVRALPRPITLEAVICKGLYKPLTATITDPITKQDLPIEEAIKRHILDDKISEVKDVEADTFIPLDEALAKKIVNKGTLKDTTSGALIPLNEAYDLQLIRSKPMVFNLLQALLSNYYLSRSGKILNPITGEEITLQKAIDFKLIDPVTTRIKDDKRGRIIELTDAIRSNLVDPEKGLLTEPALPLDQAYLKGYILSTVLPWSLQETLAQKVYDPKTGQFNINGANINLVQAIEGGVVNPNILTVKDPRSDDIITLKDAINLRIIDPIKGLAYDPLNNTELNFYDAQDRGLIVPYKSQITLPEAVFKGFYDPTTGKFINPKSKERLQTESAINRGYVDTSSTLVTIDEELVTFERAIVEGYIDTIGGAVINNHNEPIDFNEAFERGLLVEVGPPIPLSEAITKGLYDEDSQLFLDPQTGNYLTLIEAIEINLIDADSVSVKDTRAGVWRKIPLIDAIHNNYVDANTGMVRDFSNGEAYEVPLQKAFHLGILVDNKAAVSLQRAIHQGLYDDVSGKIVDPNTDRKITLHEAIRKFIINPLLPFYFDKKRGKLLTLTDTCRLGIVDKRNGTIKDLNSDDALKMSDALNKGIIVDIETANFGLYEVLEMGLYDPDDGMIVHPATGRKYTLKEACVNELVNPETSLVKNSKQNKYIYLPEAITNKLIDDELGVFKLPNGNTIDLLKAKRKGLIVTVRRGLTLEEAVLNCLYRPDSGKFADPVTGDFYDISQALTNNLINPSTTAFKDPITGSLKSLPLAIQDGKIDIDKGRVFDGKAKQTYNFDVALDKGLIITLDQPLIEEAMQKSVVDSSRSSKTARECTLEVAIKFDLLDPDKAVIKDLQSGKFKTVNAAINDNLLDINKMLTFDIQKDKVKPRVLNYDQGIMIYLEEPLTFAQAVELQYLDINCGKFTDPQTNEVLSLKDSLSLGFIDPDTALIKDGNKKKLIKLPEGFRKGLIDADKGNVLDSTTSKLYTLPTAIDSGLLITPSRGFTLIETLIYGLYNPTTGGFTCPFTTTSIIDRKRLTLNDAIATNLIDPSSTVIKEHENGGVISLLQAIDTKLIDGVNGKIRDINDDKEIDLIKAHEKGLILPAEQRVSLFDFLLCFLIVKNT